MPPAEQQRYEVRLDWGSEGLAAIAPGAGAIVLVDVLSFTTTVEIAVSYGLEVVPQRGAGSGGTTLAPSSVTVETAEAVLADGGGRVIVASPDGSRLALEAAPYGLPVIAASLRNRTAVARWLLCCQEAAGERLRVAVVAAGETRSDGSLRFTVEDHLAAGAVVDALADVGIDFCSPEAAAAASAFSGLSRAVGHLLTASVSGGTSADDVGRRDLVLAGQVDVSECVPRLVDGAFRRA